MKTADRRLQIRCEAPVDASGVAGSTIRADRDANEQIYGVGYITRQIVVEQNGGTPAATAPWLDILKTLS